MSPRCATCLLKILASCALQNVEEHQVREVLKCIIHTIIFNRALGHVSPRDMDLQLIDVSYVEVDDEDIERQVNNSLRDVEGFLSTHRVRSGANARRVRACTGSFWQPMMFHQVIMNGSGLPSTPLTVAGRQAVMWMGAPRCGGCSWIQVLGLDALLKCRLLPAPAPCADVNW
jgi:hypothetical protein